MLVLKTDYMIRTTFLKHLIILRKVFNLPKYKRGEIFSMANFIKILFKKLKTLSLKCPVVHTTWKSRLNNWGKQNCKLSYLNHA